MRRQKHSLSHYRLVTGDMGELLPVGCVEVLPGDSFRAASAALIRLSPLVTPVMHPVQVRIHHWYVPHRLVWSGFEDFITGGPDGEGGSAGAYPTISAGGSGFTAGGLADYLGIPPGVADLSVSALPFRSYNLIYNEFYRDEDLVTAVSQDSTSVQKVAWEKDYFTAARPWTQKGPAVSLPLGTRAPVKGIGALNGTYGLSNISVRETDETLSSTYAAAKLLSSAGVNNEVYVEQNPSQAGWPNIYADLSQASSVDVNTVREAFALQRYAEARAQYGSRYTEYLRYLGVRPSDARLQRPEYLGGGKQTIAFSEVLQTGPDSADEGVASLKGHGIAAVRTRAYQRYFEEHGYVLSLLSVRPRSMYGDSLHRGFSRRVKEDYYQKELELIGQQEVFQREIYAESDANGGDTVFGYQDRYAEYRHHPSTVHGEFRSTLNDWHLARLFSSEPVLNQSFVECVPSKRIFAEQTQDVLWMMVQNNIAARRMVGRGGQSRIV